jgi:hypothetical protein
VGAGSRDSGRSSGADPRFDQTLAASTDDPGLDRTIEVARGDPSFDRTLAAPPADAGFARTIASAPPESRAPACASSAASPPTLSRGASLGRYVVLPLLGRGGMGEV